MRPIYPKEDLMKVSRVFLLIVGVLALATAASAVEVTMELRSLAVAFPSPAGEVRIDCNVLSGSEVYVHVSNLDPDSYILVLEDGNGARTTIGTMPVKSRAQANFQFHTGDCPLAFYQRVLVLRGPQQTLFATLPH
jgi:hypothetical protein